MTPGKSGSLNKKYGKPYNADMTLNTDWEESYLTSIDLPFPMRIAWDKDEIVHSIRVNKNAAEKFEQALADIWREARVQIKERDGYERSTAYYDKEATKLLQHLGLDLFGGVFSFRAKKKATTLSKHAWAIAIDIDPEHNPLGAKHHTMPDWYVKCWTDAGFTWGACWKSRPDPMHFELA